MCPATDTRKPYDLLHTRHAARFRRCSPPADCAWQNADASKWWCICIDICICTYIYLCYDVMYLYLYQYLCYGDASVLTCVRVNTPLFTPAPCTRARACADSRRRTCACARTRRTCAHTCAHAHVRTYAHAHLSARNPLACMYMSVQLRADDQGHVYRPML